MARKGEPKQPMLPVDKKAGQLGRLPEMQANKNVSPGKATAAKKQVVTNLTSMYDRGTPQEHEAGRIWYPKVNEATEKGVRKHNLDSTLHGAGIVSAVSPNMDWDNANIHAFDELHKLKGPQWAAIARSSTHMAPHPETGNMRQVRSPEAASILQGMSISKAPDSNLLKAKRIMDGEHPDKVLDPRTAPKTNSFMHNIADPSARTNPHTGHALATIDGRAHDIGINRMLGWTTDRGISSSAGPQNMKRGVMSRYEHFADAHAQAAHAVSGGDMAPSEFQAHTWVIGKRVERQKPDAPKDRGPNRYGQPY